MGRNLFSAPVAKISRRRNFPDDSVREWKWLSLFRLSPAIRSDKNKGRNNNAQNEDMKDGMVQIRNIPALRRNPVDGICKIVHFALQASHKPTVKNCIPLMAYKLRHKPQSWKSGNSPPADPVPE